MNGLVLGSGAALGYAHIGVLKILEKEGIEFDFIVGCSIGSLIGALYASGMSAYEIEHLALSLKPTKLLRLVMPSRPSQALLNSSRIRTFLEEIIPKKTFEELKKPLAIVATSLLTGKIETFTSGELLPAIMASISIPIIFQPVKIGDKFYVDGGVISPLPVRIARILQPEARILAVDLTSSDKHKIKAEHKEKISIYESALYSVILMQIELSEREKHLADLVLTPKLNEFEFYEFYRQEEIIKKGEEEALKNLEKIRKIFS
ncbi:MAG: patatin-like phospholipase family protein [Actinobacteria bacterium]|nr:patatin-like phospholipase family protein [Actinomycetota bacterium]